MNLTEYKKIKLAEVEYFFRGINFNNIGKNGREFPLVDKTLIIEGNLYDINYINGNKNCRRLVQPFLMDLNSLGYEFMTTDICFAGSMSEVDMALEKLVVNIMKRIEEFKLDVMDDYHSRLDRNSRIAFQTPELNGINIKIGDKVFPWLKGGSMPLENEVEVFDDVRSIMHMIYLFPKLEELEIKKYQEFKRKKDELWGLLKDLTKYLDNGAPLDKKIAQNFQKIFRSRNLEELVYLFNDTVDYISQVTGINLDELKESVDGPSNNPKRSK